MTQSFPPETHLLGDPAYPLTERLLVPYKDTGRLGRREHNFNYRLSTARCTIERAFALLKGRFRRLKALDMSRVDRIPQVIIACCVLHNVCIEQLDSIDADSDTSDLSAECAEDSERRSDFSSGARKAGQHKRDMIATKLLLSRQQ